MNIRKAGYEEYGITKQEERLLLKQCAVCDVYGKEALLKICYEVNEYIADYLFISLTKGISYEWLSARIDMHYSKVDFYAYRRKVLYLFKRAGKLGQLEFGDYDSDRTIKTRLVEDASGH